MLDQAPSDQGVFGEPVFCDNLVEKVGLDRDDNKNLTRRMLFILESVPATAGDVYAAARERVLPRYLDESIKDFRPPRFLLNDTVRYWRTICVDFAGKEQAGPEKWGLRNAKLRTSRKVLFAGGLLPIFECVTWSAARCSTSSTRGLTCLLRTGSPRHSSTTTPVIQARGRSVHTTSSSACWTTRAFGGSCETSRAPRPTSRRPWGGSAVGRRPRGRAARAAVRGRATLQAGPRLRDLLTAPARKGGWRLDLVGRGNRPITRGYYHPTADDRDRAPRRGSQPQKCRSDPRRSR